MQSLLQSNLEKIAKRKVVRLNDYEMVDIIADEQTVAQIKKICRQTGLTVSQVIEGIIRTGLEQNYISVQNSG